MESSVPSLSKSQDQVSTSPVDKSVNVTASEAGPLVGVAEKSADAGV